MGLSSFIRSPNEKLAKEISDSESDQIITSNMGFLICGSSKKKARKLSYYSNFTVESVGSDGGDGTKAIPIPLPIADSDSTKDKEEIFKGLGLDTHSDSNASASQNGKNRKTANGSEKKTTRFFGGSISKTIKSMSQPTLKITKENERSKSVVQRPALSMRDLKDKKGLMGQSFGRLGADPVTETSNLSEIFKAREILEEDSDSEEEEVDIFVNQNTKLEDEFSKDEL